MTEPHAAPLPRVVLRAVVLGATLNTRVAAAGSAGLAARPAPTCGGGHDGRQKDHRGQEVTAPTVPLNQLGSREQAHTRGVTVMTDWRGEPAISLDDAAQWHADQAAAMAEYQRGHREWQEQTERYEADRLAAARTAGAQAYEQALRDGRGQPYAQSVQVEARTHAGAQYERTHPRPRMGGQPGCQLIFVPEAEEGSTVARVVGKLRGPAKPAPILEDVTR